MTALQELLPESDPRRSNVSRDLIHYVTDRKGHDRRYAIAPDKIQAEVGWQLAGGWKATAAWGADFGAIRGDNNGLQLTLTKTGIIRTRR